MRGAGWALLVFGAIHGDEPASVAAVRALRSTRSARELPHWRMIVVAAVNPDGLARRAARTTRTASISTATSRRATGRRAPAAATIPGPAPRSEPESGGAGGADRRAGGRARIVAMHQPFRCVNWDGAGGAGRARWRSRAAGPRWLDRLPDARIVRLALRHRRGLPVDHARAAAPVADGRLGRAACSALRSCDNACPPRDDHRRQR